MLLFPKKEILLLKLQQSLLLIMEDNLEMSQAHPDVRCIVYLLPEIEQMFVRQKKQGKPSYCVKSHVQILKSEK